MEADYDHYLIRALGFENPSLSDPQSSSAEHRAAYFDALLLEERLEYLT
jgi:hypothetical protein